MLDSEIKGSIIIIFNQYLITFYNRLSFNILIISYFKAVV